MPRSMGRGACADRDGCGGECVRDRSNRRRRLGRPDERSDSNDERGGANHASGGVDDDASAEVGRRGSVQPHPGPGEPRGVRGVDPCRARARPRAPGGHLRGAVGAGELRTGSRGDAPGPLGRRAMDGGRRTDLLLRRARLDEVTVDGRGPARSTLVNRVLERRRILTPDRRPLRRTAGDGQVSTSFPADELFRPARRRRGVLGTVAACV